MAQLTIRLLGSFTVERNEQPVTTFRSLKNQALLAYLAVEAARPHTRPALAGLLWPEQPENEALLNLRQALFRLRNVLANDEATPPFLQITPATVQFDQRSDHWLDATAFTHLLDACDHHARTTPNAPPDHRRHCRPCSERLAQAVDLYQGEFMHGIYINDSPALEEWLLLRREWFQHQALAALYDLAAWHEAQGDFARAYSYAHRQLTLDSLREEAYRQAMRTLALDGKRSEAIAQYEACCAMLYQELGVPPTPETEALMQQIEAGIVPSAGMTATPVQVAAKAVVAPQRLPTVGTTFVGREAEIARLRELLLDPTHRLVTVVGPGGVGKTRLVLAAATDLAGAFANGLCFVALAGVADEGGLLAALAGALGFTFQGSGEPQQQLFDYLYSRETLLLLDNFEQLMAAAPLVQALLTHAPRLKMLVTSRERLNFQSEMVLALTGLPTPPVAGETDAQRFSSIQLFVERAQRSPLGFTLDEETLPQVVEICRLVEGLPLGIELAAGWADHYTCAEIAQALRDNLDFLTSTQGDLPTRHRSLRAAFDYSWRLLTLVEQQALAQMTVFRGAFSRSAAQAVLTTALPHLLALVNKSLVRLVAPGRYALHEVVRQFAAEALTAPQAVITATSVEERHAAYYLQLVSNQAGLFGQTPQKVMAENLQELDNIRQAWRWAVSHRRADLLGGTVNNLARIYDLAGLYREAATVWQTALAQWPQATAASSSQLSQPERHLISQLHLAQARTATVLGDYVEARQQAESALILTRQTTDPLRQALGQQQMGLANYRLGDQATALPLLATAVTLARASQDARVTADCLLSLGEVQMYQGENSGRASFQQALHLYRTVGDRRGEAAALSSLGLFAHMQSDFAQSKDFFEQALQIQRALGDRHSEAMTLNNLAGLYGKQGNYPLSDQYLRQTLHLARLLGYRTGEMQALISLGVNQMAQRHNEAARATFEEALPMARQSGHLRSEGALLNNLGNLASDEQAYATAETFYQQALTVAHKSGDRYHLCGRLHNLGNMRRFQGDYVGAQHYYAEAVTIAEEIGDRWIEGSARADLALAEAFLCNHTQAVHHANQALLLASAIGDRWCECKALSLLGWLAVEQRHDHKGLTRIEEAIALAQAAQEVGVEGAAHGRRGFALLLLGDPIAALAAFERSLTLRRQTGERVQIVTPLAGLALAQVTLGNLAQAQTQTEQILRQMGDRPLGVADNPVTVYAACLRVLRAAGDSRATTLHARAEAHLTEQARQIEDDQQRARFVQMYERMLAG